MHPTSLDYREVNRDAWDAAARAGTESSRPFGQREFANAQRILDPQGWLPWPRLSSVLCLASGGGQQGPLFASLGLTVTVVDISPRQLALDARVARRHGFKIECVEADMCDLALLGQRRFDLVYQPVSVLYVPDVRSVYRGVAALLPSGGLYHVQHWNPVQMQIPHQEGWDGSAYGVTTPQRPRRPTLWDPDGASDIGLCYIHPLSELVGGLCESGFVVARFGEWSARGSAREPGTHAHLARYVPTVLVMLARRRAPGVPTRPRLGGEATL